MQVTGSNGPQKKASQGVFYPIRGLVLIRYFTIPAKRFRRNGETVSQEW